MAWMKHEHTRTRQSMNELEDRLHLYTSWIDRVKKRGRVQPIRNDLEEGDEQEEIH